MDICDSRVACLPTSDPMGNIEVEESQDRRVLHDKVNNEGGGGVMDNQY